MIDAYREFAQAPYDDYKDMASALPADTIVGWLESPKTAPYRYGLYASLLGHAGGKQPEKYGKVLKGMIDDPEKRKGSGIDRLPAHKPHRSVHPRDRLEVRGHLGATALRQEAQARPGLLKIGDLTGPNGNGGVRGAAFIAAIFAAVTAILTVHFLTRYFKKGNLRPFGVYCITFGIFMIGFIAIVGTPVP